MPGFTYKVPMSLFDSKDAITQLIVVERPVIYNTVAASILMLWDACILLKQEVELIWWSPNNFTKFLYLCTRYLSIIVAFQTLIYTDTASIFQPSPTTCYRRRIFLVVSGQVLYYTSDIIFIMRVHAFYGNNKRVLIILVALFICQTAALIEILALTVPHMIDVPSSLPPNVLTPSCIYVKFPKLFSKYWIPGLVFESILFSMVMFRFFSGIKGRSRIWRTFILDGTWAFVIIFATLMWNNLAFMFTTTQAEISLAWAYTVISICGTRVILNLRAAAQDDEVDSTWNTGVGNQLRFIGNSTPSLWLAAAEDVETPSRLDLHIADSPMP